jgi:parvulin-like peptidyl-prolyl isomerase
MVGQPPLSVNNLSNPEPSSVLHIGDQVLAAADVVPLLQRYGMLPALIKELVIDRAIAAIALTPEQQQGFLAQRGLGEGDLLTLAQRAQKLQQYKVDTWGHQVESHFLQRKAHLDRVLYSLIRTRDAGLAQELYFRIKDDGQPLADLARQYSEGQEAQTGGLIGPVELSVPHPALGRILSISQPEQLWPPTRVGEWFVVVRLEKFLPARLDDATRQRLIDELFNTWLAEQVQRELQANTVSDANSLPTKTD